MERPYRSLAVLALGLLLGCGGPAPPADRLAAEPASPAGGQAAVGPNGELDGLQAKFVDVDGVSTRYFDYGTGEPIVLVHGGFGVGMSSTANNFSKNIRGLAERFRVLAVDRLGMGMTSVPDDVKALTSEATIEHIYQFIRTATQEQVHVVGHSSGSRVVFGVALAHPEVVKTLTIVAGTPVQSPDAPPPSQSPSRLQAALDSCPAPPSREYAHCRLLLLGATPETFGPDYAEAEEWMGTQPPAIATQKLLEKGRAAAPAQSDEERRQARAAANAARLETVKSGVLSMPILIVHGAQDGLAWRTTDPWRDFTRELGFMDVVGQGGTNPKVSMIIMNQASHFPYRSHPEEFNAYLTAFIDVWSRKAAEMPSGTQ